MVGSNSSLQTCFKIQVGIGSCAHDTQDADDTIFSISRTETVENVATLLADSSLSSLDVLEEVESRIINFFTDTSDLLNSIVPERCYQGNMLQLRQHNLFSMTHLLRDCGQRFLINWMTHKL